MFVNTFISNSDQVPTYTAISLKRARDLNPNIKIDFICRAKQPYFDKLNINWIDQTSLQDHPLITEFNKISPLDRVTAPQTSYPSPVGFWHRTCERIFYLAAYALEYKPEEMAHIENDVIMYYDYETLVKNANDTFSATIMSPTQATFAVLYSPHYEYLSVLCDFMLSAIKNNKISLSFYSHLSEMSLLREAMYASVIDTFCTLPFDGIPMCFDPGSYGQFLGGTNNDHGPGFKDMDHYAWSSGCEVYMKDGKPFVYHPNAKHECPLFNLHVHSKQLEKFI